MVKPEIPTLDMGRCVENFPGSRYDMILAAAARAREIQRRRLKQDQTAGQSQIHDHKPTYAALHEIEQGRLGDIRLNK